MNEFKSVLMAPMDENNQKLLQNVHPPDWVNPTPQPMYNLVVIGAGTAGLIAASGAAGLGAKVALVERNLMGGDCLNSGCVPSKSLIKSSRIASEMMRAGEFGLTLKAGSHENDFPRVMERLRRIRSEISRNDSAKRFRDELGVDVFIGNGKFAGRHGVQVNDKMLSFKKAVITAGARPFHPGIEGLKEAGFQTNETIFNLTELPEKLMVIGGGPIGCELAQAFSRLGSEVSIIQNSRFLPREDPDASALLAKVFAHEGIHVMLNATVKRIERAGSKKKIVVEMDQLEHSVEGDEILIGAGRVPNVDGLNLESAGVAYDLRSGVKVNDRLQTTNPRIYAAGDICMNWKFTHAADAASRIVVQNALFLGRAKLSSLNMPWCTYTDPEVAHVGLYEADAIAKNIESETIRVEMKDIDRARTDGEAEGFIKVIVKKGTDKILGATIVSKHAGDLISEISVAMSAKLGLKKLSGVIHPYPTQAEVIKRAGDAYNRKRLTPRIAGMVRWWMNLQRR